MLLQEVMKMHSVVYPMVALLWRDTCLRCIVFTDMSEAIL